MKTPDLNQRQLELELVKTINKNPSVEAAAVRQLLGMRYEAAKEKLVTAAPEDMLRLQGEAQCLKRLNSDFTRQLMDPQE